MAENEVFWLGKRSRTGEQRKNFADEQEFVDHMQNACVAHGAKIIRFVSAKGVYGTWLLEFERNARSQRIVWNGKDQKLVLQIALSSGGWAEPRSTNIASVDVNGFIDGINELLKSNTDTGI